MILTVIRHGQTPYNAKRLIQGQIDIPLNETGIKQSEHLANEFLHQGISYDVMISSPLSRALETATIIKKIIGHPNEIIIEHSFIERSFGKLDGLTLDEVFPLISQKYQADDYETDESLIERVITALYHLETKYPQQNVLAVVHSQVIKAIYIHLDPKKYTFTNFLVENVKPLRFEVINQSIKAID
jgi:uncharacterized phosphatase